MAFDEAVGSRRDLQEEENPRGQWSQAQGGRANFCVVLDEERPNEVKAEERGKKSRRRP